MASGAALKLTTALYYTPSGRSIQAEGIAPDIDLAPVKVSAVEADQELVKERDLAGHLQNGNGDNKSEMQGAGGAAPESLIETDYQLYEALNLLKGLNILQQRT